MSFVRRPTKKTITIGNVDNQKGVVSLPFEADKAEAEVDKAAIEAENAPFDKKE